jgi:TPP-dependent pyruvate/acetoin dehydrogenase alpha subunit
MYHGAMKWPEPLTERDALDIYYHMQLNRSLENRLIALYRQSIITATVFTSRGQEATSVGSAYALGPEDYVSPITRNIGTMLVRGVRPRDIFTQYMGKTTSPTGGKERIHYFGDLTKGVVASLSVLGGMVPVMAGVALAAKIQRKTSVSMTYLGEGAVSTGDFHEGMNLASVLRLPFVLIIENNQYAYSTPATKQAAIPDFALRARAYGIPGEIVDGNKCARGISRDAECHPARSLRIRPLHNRSKDHAYARPFRYRQFLVRAQGRARKMAATRSD